MCIDDAMAATNDPSVVTELENYIESTEGWLGELLTSFGWSEESLTQSEEKVQCSVSADHFVPKSLASSHEESCVWARQGYSKADLEADQSSDFYYEKATTVVPVKLHTITLVNLLSSFRMENVAEASLPRTLERYMSDLSPAERLNVYEYCIETAKQVNRLVQISDEELMLLGDSGKKKNSGPKSRLAVLAEERDLKRRRQSYKGKSVHTGKKSHLQVLREVIEGQMEQLKPPVIKEEEQANRTDTSESHEPRYSARSRSRSRSRSRDRKKKKKYRKKSRSRSRSRHRERSRSRHRKHKKRDRDKEK